MTSPIARLLIMAAVALPLGACGVRYYPMTPAQPLTALEARTCAQLADDLQSALQTQQNITRIEAAASSNSRNKPRLYSTRKSDADAAVTAHIAQLRSVMANKGCVA